MKKLSKTDLQAREEVTKKLGEAHSLLTSAVEEYNDAVAEAWAKVEDCQNGYNEALHAASEWCEGIASQIEDYVNDKSEKWQEGEKAEAYENWKGEYEGIDFSDSELSQPDELSLEVQDPCEEIEGLSTEVES